MATPALKYLFVVLYKDGTTYHQTDDDVSAIDPKRSCFTDATCRIENGKFVLDETGAPISRLQDIYRFLLIENTNNAVNAKSYLVDLETGHFETACEPDAAMPFRFHDRRIPYSNRRLIFFRQHAHHINVMPGEAPPVEAAHEVSYCFGWQANLPNGQAVQFVMEID